LDFDELAGAVFVTPGVVAGGAADVLLDEAGFGLT
jgi:hypothetical protein